MSTLGNNKFVALGVAVAIIFAAAYANNRDGDGTPAQIDVKGERGISEKVALVLPQDLWPRQ